MSFLTHEKCTLAQKERYLPIKEFVHPKREVFVLDHIALNVSDIKESEAWYREKMGFECTYIDETWAMLQKDGLKLALTLPNQHPPHIAIRVNDISEFPEGKIGEHRDGSKYLYQKDPDGNVVEWIYYP